MAPVSFAHVVTSKCLDSIPLYRQSKVLSRAGVPVARTTLGDLFHAAASLTEPLYQRLFRWGCLLLTLPVLLYSHMLQTWFGFRAPTFPGSAWVGPLFAVIIFIYGGVPFLQSGHASGA